MVTIKDIAKEAGVSHGTVSNVLNNRGNVRSDKIKLVEEAADKLGYRINSQAQVLRKGLSNKCYVLIFREMKNQYSEFITGLAEVASPYDFEIVYIKKPTFVETIFLEKLSQLPYAIICLGFSLEEKYSRLDTEVKIFELDTYKGKATVSFNQNELLQQFKQTLKEMEVGRVSFLSLGFHSDGSMLKMLEEEVREVYQTNYTQLRDVHQLLGMYPQLKQLESSDVLVMSDRELLQSVKDIYTWFGLESSPRFYLVGTSEWIRKSDTHYLHLDYRLLATCCPDLLVNGQVKLLPIQAESKTYIPKTKSNEEALRLLIVTSPMSKALKIISARYKFVTGQDIEIVEKSYEEILQLMSTPSLLKDIDIIRVDMAWLPTFGKDLFLQLDSYMETTEINQELAFPISKEYTHIDEAQLSFPLDISSQILVYRKDIFENALVQRQYYEKIRKNLLIPTTFQEFDTTSQFFTKKFNQESPVCFGHSISLKSSVVAACDFIPRMRESLLSHQMDLREINNIFTEYRQSVRYAKTSDSEWWESFVGNLRRGETAMEILFSNYATPLFQEDNEGIDYDFAYATIPGKQPVIGGGSIGINRQSHRVEASLQYIRWLYTEEISILLAYLGGFLPSKHVVNHTGLRTLFPWLENFETTFGMGSRTKWFQFETDFAYEQVLGQELIKEISNTNNGLDTQ